MDTLQQPLAHLEDEIRGSLLAMGAKPEWLTSTPGDETSRQRPLETAKAVRQLDLTPSKEWRSRFIRLDESHHQKVERMACWGEWFIRRASLNQRQNGTWLVIGGPPGVGKTHLANSVLAWFESYAIDLWYSGRWGVIPKVTKLDWPAVAEDERDSATKELVQTVSESSIVILDDVGAEADRYKSGVAVSKLRQVVNACENRWFLMNTNIDKSGWEERFGARGADRLRAAWFMSMTGVPSYRPKLKAGKRPLASETP